MSGERCIICKIELDDKGTPYSVCYDPEFEHNVWGGDSHEYVGYLCKSCFDGLKEGVE